MRWLRAAGLALALVAGLAGSAFADGGDAPQAKRSAAERRAELLERYKSLDPEKRKQLKAVFRKRIKALSAQDRKRLRKLASGHSLKSQRQGKHAEAKREFWWPKMGANAPQRVLLPQPLSGSTLSIDGEPRHEPQRDAEYTNELSEQIVASFLSENVVMSTHLVGHALLSLLKHKNPGMDLYRLLRTGGHAPAVPVDELASETGRILGAVRDLPNGPRLSEELSRDPRSIVDDALRAYACYHVRPAAVRRGDRIFHEDRNLLLYYGNRLRGYDLGRALA